MSSSRDGSDKEECGGLITYEHLPLDLKVEILWRLPAKYVVRFCCVSNLWSSIITTPDFVNHPSNRPYLLVCVRKKDECFVTAWSQHQNRPTERLIESYNMTIPWEYNRISRSRGLSCFSSAISYVPRIGVWNPTMRQFVVLPKTIVRFSPVGLLGYDPTEDKYKVLCVSTRSYKRGINEEAEVLTLGDEHETWRVANGCPFHRFTSAGPCINGVIYYEANISRAVDKNFPLRLYKEIIIGFDVRFEKFKVMEQPQQGTNEDGKRLFNYQGRLAWLYRSRSCRLSIKLWILEDDGKQEWSCINLLLPFPLVVNPVFQVRLIFNGALDTTGELMFTAYLHSRFDEFYVLYYDPRSNGVREVRFEGAAYEELTRGSNGVDEIFLNPDHIENFMSLRKSIYR